MWAHAANGQAFLVIDTARIALNPDRDGKPAPVLPFLLSGNTDYSVTASMLLSANDPVKDEKGQLLLRHALRCSWTIGRPGGVSFTNTFSHRLGFQLLFDSLCRVESDESLLRTRIEYRFPKGPGLTLDSELSTRLLNGYDYSVNDSGHITRTLNSSFLTPFTWNMSLGLTFQIRKIGSVMTGISGFRLTCLRDTSVFSEQGTGMYLGVRRGSDHLLEYGLSCRFQADRIFWKIVRWNCDMMLFKGYRKPADLNLKNLLEVRPVKFFVISLQSRICYEEDISDKLFVENILSVGFNLRDPSP